MTNAAGPVAWRADYAPYGTTFTVRTGATIHQPLCFPGQIAQDGSETYYNVFRHYRGTWGRYTQTDPIGLKAGPNLFAYAAGEPSRFIDPYGLIKVSCCDENLQPAINNAKRRMSLLEQSASEYDPSGTNRVVASTLCQQFTMRDALGNKRTFGLPKTTRNDRFDDGKCEFLCTSVHEAYHREQCREFGEKGLAALLTDAQWAWPAYREELRCLTSAEKNMYLVIRSSPPGFVEY